ncbi:MAG TPA: hypothetical protein VFW38_06515 [Solirubrobacteraceae bacterium]|nr:hypothetical protein [Solirubrobacteraceae bacterium]
MSLVASGASESSGNGAGGDEQPLPRRPRDWLREQRRLPRRRLIVGGSIALVLFLAFSALLARYLSTENVERTDVLKLLQAQAAGDANRVIAQLSGCRRHAGCVAQAERDAQTLRRTGSVKILTLSSQTAYALTSAKGTTRVAWTVIGHLPSVQCVSVTRSGNFLSGLSVTLTGLSAPIPGEADC